LDDDVDVVAAARLAIVVGADLCAVRRAGVVVEIGPKDLRDRLKGGDDFRVGEHDRRVLGRPGADDGNLWMNCRNGRFSRGGLRPVVGDDPDVGGERIPIGGEELPLDRSGGRLRRRGRATARLGVARKEDAHAIQVEADDQRLLIEVVAMLFLRDVQKGH
jgi:hypothetical protein